MDEDAKTAEAHKEDESENVALLLVVLDVSLEFFNVDGILLTHLTQFAVNI